MRAVAVIPARYASTRFPGKLLKELGGLSVIRRTVQQARRAERLDRQLTERTNQRDEAQSQREETARAASKASTRSSGTTRSSAAIAASSGAMGDMLEDGVHGYVFQAGDSESCAHTLFRAHRTEDGQRRMMGERLREMIRRDFTTDRETERFIELLATAYDHSR